MSLRLLQVTALAAFFCASGAYAGYAQLAPPEGWSGGGGAAATYRYPSAANASAYANGTVQTNAALRVNGQAVQVPARMRVAANAGRFAAAAIFLHPGLRTAAAVAGWLGVAGLVYDVADGLWKKLDSSAAPSDGSQYRTNEWPANGPWYSSEQAACDAALAYLGKPGGVGYTLKQCSGGLMIIERGTETRMGIQKSASSCPAGWFTTPAGCVQTPPMRTVTQPEFEQMVPDAKPMPPELPGIVWPATWPVEVPDLQPMFIPTGNPVKNPAYDPAKPTSPDNQPYTQPGIDVKPAPSPSSPWQVDLQPVNRPTSNPNPGSDPVPNTNPDGTPKPDQGDKPREDNKEERDFCDKHPDVLACQKIDLDTPEGEIPRKQIDVSWSPVDLGLGSGSCPAPVQIYENKQFSYQSTCDNLYIIKPLVIAIALFVGGMILFGGRADQ